MGLVLHVHKIEKITEGEGPKNMELSCTSLGKPGRGSRGN